MFHHIVCLLIRSGDLNQSTLRNLEQSPTHCFVDSKLHSGADPLGFTHLRVVHVPQQVALLRVQDEVPAQEPAAVLDLLDVQEAADAILSVHVRHRDPGQFGPPWGITGTLGERRRNRLGVQKQV